MQKNPFVFILFFLIIPTFLIAQNQVNGIVLDNDENPIPGAELFNETSDIIATTNLNGKFSFEVISKKSFQIQIVAPYFLTKTMIIDPQDNRDLRIELIPDSGNQEETDFQVITLSNDEVDEGLGSQNVSSILQASRDVFANTTAFQFNVARFRARGYNGNYSRNFMNGMPVNDLDDGRVNWSYWGGLNDVLRARQATYGLEESEFSVGDLGGAQNIDLRARYQRSQIRPSFAISNRTYRNRAMFTYSSGVIDNKYAISVSGSKRWGNEGFVDATFYDAYSYFLSFDYLLNEKHTLNIVAFGAPTQRGRGGASVQEMNDISGSNYYNSYWGYQNGKKRNSRVYNSFQPIFMLRHDYSINNKLELNTTIAGQVGRFGSSRLDWYNVSDPRPDYYRNLPSFYSATPEIAQKITEHLSIEENRQLDWAYFYYINQNKIEDFSNANGIEGNVVSGYRSKYIIAEQRFDDQKLSINSIFKYIPDAQYRINGGFTAMHERNHNFQSILDLLGGDYYVDIDRFAERDFPSNSDEIQNDLNIPNKISYVGDVFGFDYNTITQRGLLWGQIDYLTSRFDAFLGIETSYTRFWREGFMRNGKFPDSSFGKSAINDFLNYSLKGGVSLKIDGRNYINILGLHQTNAPFTRYAFISPRTRDEVVPNLVSSKVYSGEISYHHKSPLLKAKFSAYYTLINDQTEVNSFYHDELRGFVNFILTDIDQRHTGIEVAGDLKLSTTLSLVAAASIGEYIYTSRPLATISQDNNAMLLEENQTIYQKNFFLPNTPQQAYTIGLNYNSPKYWFLNANFNYFDQMYLDFNPTRRTENAVYGLIKNENPELWEDIIFQERIPSNFTVDLFGGKSWRIKDQYIYLTIGVNNLLNNQNFIIGGYEQSRFDFEGKDVSRFPPRYFYAYGTNYFIGVSFRL